MDWQALLTSDMAFIIYELIIFVVAVFLIARLRKQIKDIREKQEKAAYIKQRKSLDSMLSNSKGGH